MDDPWGSPWADEAAQPLPPLKTSRPTTPNKPIEVEHQNRSPWDDEGDFGELATRLEGNPVEQQNVIDSDNDSDELWEFEAAPTYGTNGAENQPKATLSSSKNQELYISSPSAHNDEIETLQKPPRTSPDEEIQRPPEAGQAPPKVKQLVKLFDGLAVQAPAAPAAPAAPVGRGSSDASSDTSTSSTAQNYNLPIEDDTYETDDFNEFEESDSSVKFTKSLKGGQDFEDKGLQPPTEEKTPVSNIQPQSVETLSPQAGLRSKVMHPVAFDVDITLSNQIFGKSAEAVEKLEPSAKGELEAELSTVVQDSFSSVEQRKIWYRISRYGTMRKHNSGDEDYVRMNWGESKIRDETLKVVSRWMEQDRIGGVVLGGTAKLESMFGWGKPTDEKSQIWPGKTGNKLGGPPNALPVPFGIKLFDITSGRNSANSSSASNKSLESPSHPRAQFTWSTTEPASVSDGAGIVAPSSSSPSSVQAPLPEPRSPLQMVQPTFLRLQSKSNGQNLLQVKSPPSLPNSVGENSQDQQDGEEEWGDMVSSTPIDSPSIPFGTTYDPPEAVQNPTGSGNAVQDSETIVAIDSKRASLRDGSVASLSNNGWTTADSSFFNPQAPSATSPALDPAVQEKSSPLENKSSTLKKPQPSDEEADQEATVRSIIQNLPDLSYMLRR